MACVVGFLVIGVLTVLILLEDSVQPLQDRYHAREMVTQPLVEGVTFRQELSIPVSLDGEDFLVGLFFGSFESHCSGVINVVLKQGDHVQERTSSILFPSPTLRYRFSFSGFSAGPATIEIQGHSENDENAPGLVYAIREGEGLLTGPEIPENASAFVDWFRVVSGEDKLGKAFPNLMISGLWLFSFVGLVGLAWRGMRPEAL